MEAEDEVWILDKFFFRRKGHHSSLQTGNKKNLVNPQFILQSGHGHLEAVNNRPRRFKKPRSEVKFVDLGLKKFPILC